MRLLLITDILVYIYLRARELDCENVMLRTTVAFTSNAPERPQSDTTHLTPKQMSTIPCWHTGGAKPMFVVLCGIVRIFHNSDGKVKVGR